MFVRIARVRRLLGFSAAWALLSCGGGSSVSDTNTNWLQGCDTDLECGSLYSCQCGFCTVACQQDTDCVGRSTEATCAPAAQDCATTGLLCQGAPSEPEPVISDFQSSMPALPGGGGEVELSWSVTGADSVLIRIAGGSDEAVTGETWTTNITQTTTFTLVATKDESSAEQSLLVEVSSQGRDDWTTEPGGEISRLNAVAADSDGGVYVAGLTQAGPNVPSQALVGKFLSESQQQVWSTTLGEAGDTYANGVAVDAQGNMLFVGSMEGTLNGEVAEGQDGFIVKYSAMGELLWTQRVGAADGDEVRGVAVDAGGSVFVVGRRGQTAETLSTGFVARYNSAGAEVWTQLFGDGDGTTGFGIALDATGQAVNIVGSTSGALEGANQGLTDAFVAQYAADGTPVWARQIGTAAEDNAQGIGVDADGNIYISGQTGGALEGANLGYWDGHVAKYSASGEAIWRRQLGTAADDGLNGVALDSQGNVFFSGFTNGVMGEASQGGFDAVALRLSPDGDTVWTRQFGTAQGDEALGLAADPHGNVFVVGRRVDADTAPSAAFLTRLR